MLRTRATRYIGALCPRLNVCAWSCTAAAAAERGDNPALRLYKACHAVAEPLLRCCCICDLDSQKIYIFAPHISHGTTHFAIQQHHSARISTADMHRLCMQRQHTSTSLGTSVYASNNWFRSIWLVVVAVGGVEITACYRRLRGTPSSKPPAFVGVFWRSREVAYCRRGLRHHFSDH